MRILQILTPLRLFVKYAWFGRCVIRLLPVRGGGGVLVESQRADLAAAWLGDLYGKKYTMMFFLLISGTLQERRQIPQSKSRRRSCHFRRCHNTVRIQMLSECERFGPCTLSSMPTCMVGRTVLQSRCRLWLLCPFVSGVALYK